MPARFKNLGLDPRVEYFIVEEGLGIPLESVGFKGLRDGETVDIGRNNPGRFILNTFISRNHIRIQRRGNAIVLEELNSTNGTIVVQDKFQSQSPDNSAIPKPKEPNIRVLGGQRIGGTLEIFFAGDAWITAGSFAYKISVTGDTIYFQRYEKDKINSAGRVHTMSLDRQIQIGRETGDYRLPGDQFLSGKHFIIKISRKEGNRFSLFVEDLNSLNGTIVEWNNASSSPISISDDTKMGGIDFRSLPIVTQAIGNLSANISSSAIHNLVSINLDEEWQQIERMASSGITPSSERIKEYIQTSCAQDNITQDRDKILLCISDILRLEEERCDHTNPTLRDILVVLESMSNTQELRQVFLGKTI